MSLNQTSRRAGFTFVELLLVTTLVAGIGITIYATIFNGVKIWERIETEAPVEDVNVFFEKITHELRNTFDLQGIAFRGTQDEIAFPIIPSTGQGRQEIGRVTYAFNRVKGVLYRKYQNYSQVFEEEDGPAVEVMGGVRSVQFSYYGYDLKEKEYLWVEEWRAMGKILGLEEDDILPVAVRIQVGVLSDTGPEVLTRTVSIPSGCCTIREKKTDDATAAFE